MHVHYASIDSGVGVTGESFPPCMLVMFRGNINLMV